MNKYKISILLLALSSVALQSLTASADFSLSVTPFEGGSDLRYGKIDTNIGKVNKEVVVKITSDINKQYRIIQELLEPPTNAQGVALSGNSLFVYGIRGTNSFGTLNIEQQEFPVRPGRTILYTSNTQGGSDSFKLVYGLAVSSEQAQGSYRGRLGFILEPVDVSQSLVTVILNIFADISAESKINIMPADGGMALRLKVSPDTETSADTLVNIEGFWGGQFKLLQVFDRPLESSQGIQLPDEAVKFTVKEVRKGAAITKPTALSIGRQAIYTSNQFGESENFIVTYSLDSLIKFRAGEYRGTLKYYFEGPTSFLIETLNLELYVPKIFDLVVIPETGGLMQFRDIKPNEEPRKNDVIIKVNTNVARPYQVSQKVISEFIDREGHIIPKENFKLKMESLDSKGQIKFPEKTEVKIGETVLFVSDKEGSSDSFKITYELSPGVNLIPGNYSTSVVYSILEI